MWHGRYSTHTSLPTVLCSKLPTVPRPIQQALTARPELVIVSMDLLGVHGVEVARQIWADIPDMKLIFWAQFPDETCMHQTFRLMPPETVYGYLLKSASAGQFVHTVRGVLIEEQCIIARDLHRAYAHATDRQTGLTSGRPALHRHAGGW